MGFIEKNKEQSKKNEGKEKAEQEAREAFNRFYIRFSLERLDVKRHYVDMCSLYWSVKNNFDIDRKPSIFFSCFGGYIPGHVFLIGV